MRAFYNGQQKAGKRKGVLGALAIVFVAQDQFSPLTVPPAPNRYEYAAPFPALPAVQIDALNDGWGLANQIAKNKQLQGRVLWIDGTANMTTMGTAERIASKFAQIAKVGFNTVVYDVKPIIGYTLYPSRFAKKLTEWRGQSMDEKFDSLAIACVEAKKNNLSLLVSFNAFSEGHRLTRTGPGYDRPDEQTVQYEADPVVSAPWPTERSHSLHPSLNPKEFRPDEIGVYTVVPSETAEMWFVGVDARGRVWHSGSKFPNSIPDGGSVLAARDEESGGEFLKSLVSVGSKLLFETKPRFVLAQDAQNQWPLMMNPHLRSVQLRTMSYAQEVVARYDLDGVVYDDRLRFGALNADFSESTRSQFEKYLKRKVQWPDDIYKITVNPRLVKGIRPGKFYDAWLTWRALTLRNWIAEVRSGLKKINPRTLLGVYVGSWFGEYDKFGSNYSSDQFRAGFPYLTSAYQRTGYASELDFLIAGCYYKESTISNALAANLPTGRTVEAAGQLANRATRDQCWTYAGLLLSDFAGQPRALMDAMQAAAATTQGVMVFDYSHDIAQHWTTFQQAFSTPAAIPHLRANVLADVRRRRKLVDAHLKRPEAVPLYEGAPGAGH